MNSAITSAILVVACCHWLAADIFSQDDSERTVLVRVVDAQRNPVSDARLKFTFRNAYEVEERVVATDESGNGIIKFPVDVQRPTLQVFRAGYVPQTRRWHRFGEEVPDHVSMVVESGTTIGGEVQNVRGEPLEGATVALQIRVASGNFFDEFATNMILLTGEDAPRTDKNGRWSFDGVPANATVKMAVSHPRYVGDNLGMFNTEYERASQHELREQTALAKLSEGIRISGRVVDRENRPVDNAVVSARTPPQYSARVSETTNANGEFALPAGPKGSYEIVVSAKGYAPDFRLTDGGKDRPLEITLGRGTPVRIRVLETDDKPAQALISLSEHENVRPSLLYWPKTLVPVRTDAKGLFEWDNAPDGELKFNVSATWFASQDVTISVDKREEEVIVRLKRQAVFSGRVIDKKTREPIDRFVLVPVKPGSVIYRQMGIVGKKGTFQIPAYISEQFNPRQSGLGARLHLFVEHSGHRSILTEESYDLFDPKGEVVIEMDQDQPISGSIADPEGKPVTRATVTLTESSNGFLGLPRMSFGTAATDDEGKFQLPAPPSDYALIIQSPAGFLQESFPGTRWDLGELQLKPWAVVSGVVLDEAGKPVAHRTVMLQASGFLAAAPVRNETGPDGKFTFERVPYGKCEVFVMGNSSRQINVADRQNLTAKAGEVVTVTLRIESQSK